MKVDLRRLSARHPAARAGTAPAISEIDLAVGSGEQLAIIGPSGAGKTTLLHSLALALAPRSGQLQLDGRDPWSLTRGQLHALRAALFLAPQTPPLPPRQRVVTAVLAGRLPAMGLARSLRSLFYPVDIAGAHAALDRFDLAEKLFERVDRLSGGERQRVGLARALMSPARLWLIDEPLSALDPTRAGQVMDTLIAEASARRCTLVATLHQVETALERFPRIVGLRDGRVSFDLPTEQVSRPMLERLYAQHEDELHGQAAPSDAIVETATPVVMHCR